MISPTKILIHAILFGLVVALDGAEVVTVYGSQIITILLSASLVSILTILTGVGVVILSMSIFRGFRQRTQNRELVILTQIILTSFLAMYLEFQLIQHLPEYIYWFPTLSNGWILTYVVLSFVYGVFLALGERQ